MIGLNVGSGQRPFHSTKEVTWINIDSQPKWNPDVLCSGVDLPYSGSTVDYVVLHHVLEHFGCGEGEGLVKEAYRVLKPGGSLLVFVPDLKKLAVGWLNSQISTQIYMTNLYGAYMGSEDDRHKWGFDVTSLYNFLRSCAAWKAVHAGTPNLPGADIARDWWILEMECVK